MRQLAERLKVGKERVWEEMEKTKMVLDGKRREIVVKNGDMDVLEEDLRGELLIKRLLVVLFRMDKKERGLVVKILSGIDFDGAGGKLLVRWLNSEEEVSLWIKKLPAELRVVAEECFMGEITDTNEEKDVVSLAVNLAREKLREERLLLVKRLKIMEGDGKPEELEIEKVSKRLVWLDKKERLVLGYLE